MADIFIATTPADPRAAHLMAALNRQYEQMYGDQFGEEASWEIWRHAPALFAPPTGGDFVLLMRGDEAIGGGGFMRHDAETVEFKRIWTSDSHRRQGLARRVLDELEMRAAAQGYTRIYLTTGYRQAAATELYLNTGYTPLFDPDADLSQLVILPFEKAIRR